MQGKQYILRELSLKTDMRGYILMSVVFLLAAIKSFAQESIGSDNRSVFPFLSVNLGVHNIKLNDFDQVYSNSLIPEIGAKIGIPLSKRIHVIGGFYYLHKSGTSIIYNYDSDFNVISSERGGDSKFKMWLFNFGGQYSFNIGQNWLSALEGGVSFINGTENQSFSDGSVLSEAEFKGLLGFYIGALVERKIDRFGIFMNPKMIISRSDVVNLNRENYGGVNFSTGLKYYF